MRYRLPLSLAPINLCHILTYNLMLLGLWWCKQHYADMTYLLINLCHDRHINNSTNPHSCIYCYHDIYIMIVVIVLLTQHRIFQFIASAARTVEQMTYMHADMSSCRNTSTTISSNQRNLLLVDLNAPPPPPQKIKLFFFSLLVRSYATEWYRFIPYTFFINHSGQQME